MAYTNIDDPSAHFQTALWAGNSSTQTITNDGNSDLQPDWVWNKSRTTTNVHLSQDSTIGATGGVYRYLQPDNTAAEAVQTDGDGITSLNSDGFSLGYGNSNSWNATGKNYVAWQWKANGGTTSTDTTSSITSTVQVNSDAGFSIVTYTGDGTTAGGFGHGLGVAPKVVFVKRRNTAADWAVYHKDIGAANFLKLSTNDAQASGVWQGIDPSSTRVTVYQGGFVNGNGDDYVAYCFAEKQGYSKFGSYKGNGNTNGAFIYTGFKPAWVMVKQSNTARNWQIFDNKRDGYNIDYMPRLKADTNDAETASSGASMDFVSNGFKLRTSQTGANQNGGTYIYMAFAENPFTTSTGVPCTAR
jgi:hypothetical protein